MASPADPDRGGRAGRPRPPYEELLVGAFPPDSIRVEYTPGAGPIEPSLSRAALLEWPERVAAAAREGVTLTNGGLLRLVSFRAEAGTLHLKLGDTTYAEHLATNANADRRASLPWERLANPLGTSALLITSDDQLVLGLRGGQVLHCRNQIHTIGGMFEAVDAASGRVDAAGSILREVREEVGVGGEDIAHVLCRGLIRDAEHLQPELMFEVRTCLDFDGLEERWSAAESRGEHARLVHLDDTAVGVASLLEGPAPLAPHAIAALALRRAARPS